jgi:7,8-dihydroneopterin aldolase/epimerase/oxygenase
VTEIELQGIALYGFHGVNREERRDGQPFLFDLWLEVADGTGAADRIDDTVDYREVVAVVREISDGSKFQLLEALASAVADTLIARFPVEGVRVRVRKPEVRLDPAVDYAAVTVERHR